MGGEGGDGAAGGHTSIVFALAADVEVDGKGAIIADVGRAIGPGGSIDLGHGGTAGDKGGS